jgi:NitT/TauT family transport system permease protein
MKKKELWKGIFKPKENIPKKIEILITLSTFATLGLIWCLLTYTRFIPPLFLPTPDRVLRDLYNFFVHENFIVDVGHSTFRILMGFLIACGLAIPLGVLSGTYKFVHAMADKMINFFRYLPVAALIPLFILWLGIDDAEKIAVVAVGVFYLTALMATDTVAGVPKELLDIAYTLGATRREILFKVIIPACLPGLIENMSISMGAAWTYLVVAELIAANSGIGFQIIDSMRGLFVGKIFACLLVIGFLGVFFASIFRLINRVFFPWYSYGGWEE